MKYLTYQQLIGYIVTYDYLFLDLQIRIPKIEFISYCQIFHNFYLINSLRIVLND
jgi:hypothetical protein